VREATLTSPHGPRHAMHEDTAAGYDAVAEAYAERLFDELDGKPFDRAFLAAFVQAAPPGEILDLGCGPGHVARFIGQAGRRVTGIDLSPAMVAQARRRVAAATFRTGDLCALDVASGSQAAVVAFYSLIHLAPAEIAVALREMHRVLVPGGRVALAFHAGDEVRHVDELWGVKTSLDFRFLSPDVVAGELRAAGLEVLECTLRPPYAPAVEAQTERCYIVAERIR